MAEKSKIEYNWYEILDLMFYPVAEENEEKIKNRIEVKRKQWIRNESDIIKGTDCKIYLNLYKKEIIQEQMLGKNNIRKELIKDARDKYFKQVDEILRDLGDISIITEELLKKIVKTTKIGKNSVIERIQSSGKKIDYSKNEKKKKIDAYTKYYEYINKKFKYSFSEINMRLKILNKKDLYDFLHSENLDFKNLNIDKIKEKRKNLLKSDDKISAKKKLYSECENMLKNRDIKREYDEYLKYLDYKRVKEVLERTQRAFNFTKKKLSPSQSNNFINDIKEILNNTREAQDIFIGFCLEENIPYDILNNSEEKSEENIQNKISNELCDKASDAIREGRFNAAQSHLNEARKRWEDNPRIAIIQDELDKVKTAINSSNHYCDMASDSLNKGRFNEAQGYLDKARNYWAGNPKIAEIQNKLDKIKDTINSSNYYCNMASDSLNRGRLSDAHEYLKRARNYWASNPKIITIQNELDKRMSDYFCHKASEEIESAFLFASPINEIKFAHEYLDKARNYWVNNPKIVIIQNELNEIKRKVSKDLCDMASDSLNKGRFNEAQEHLDKARNYWAGNPRIMMIQNKLENSDKKLSDKACDNAKTALKDLQLKQAKKYLQEARDKWPNNSRITIIEDKLNEIIDNIKKEKSIIEHHIATYNYEEAKKAYENLKVKYPGYSNADLEQKIENIKKISQIYSPQNNNFMNSPTFAIVLFVVIMCIIYLFTNPGY